MASRYSFRCLQALRPLRAQQQPLRAYHASPILRSAETPTAPAFLSTIKADLKTAMRAKDAPRLAVLRAIITTTNNAAKTSSPIATDVQLVALLRKNLRASRDAIAEATQVGRPDLAEKEEAQAKILEEYITSSGVSTVTEAQIVEIIQKDFAEAKADTSDTKGIQGKVMQRVAQSLKGKDLAISMGEVKNLVQEIVSKA
ncbi:Yqey-like protein-domain-containing protein [Plectosphaerella plurivora]|uniref:Altered inheritance of mitochondria protein 41 n=1 Tax=Plectosphaerella plurivora TaxID=936078 RepID=A0A9P8VFW0_9PEZI|nr:Yqey-like protein-domain-containing protein [Plectosphaerella plurivora]